MVLFHVEFDTILHDGLDQKAHFLSSETLQKSKRMNCRVVINLCILFDVVLLCFQSLDRVTINLPGIHASSAKTYLWTEINIPWLGYFNFFMLDNLSKANLNLLILAWSRALLYDWYIIVEILIIEKTSCIIARLDEKVPVLIFKNNIPYFYRFPEISMYMNEVIDLIIAYEMFLEKWQIFAETDRLNTFSAVSI